MDINIDYNNTKYGSTGYSIEQFLREKKDEDSLSIVFTKGKLELEIADIVRVNIFENSMIIVLKDKSSHLVNLSTVTQIT